MGRFLKKVGRKAKKVAKKLSDNVVEQVQAKVTESLGDVDWGDSLDTVKAKSQECATASRETVEICNATAEKREQMIAFAAEIQSTLSSSFGSNNDDDDQQQPRDVASVLETIRELTAGDKIRQAMELAKGLDEAALTCVDKSVQMMDAMEAGMDALPDIVEQALESAAGDDDDDDSDDDDEKNLLEGLERDMQDVQTCIKSIQELNLSTAMQVGLEAFTQLTDKAKRSQSLFNSVRDFAADVQDICDAFTDMDVSSMASKSKDMIRCVSLCENMKLIAQGAGKLLQLLIDLFSITADRISALWAALAFAKDCMTDSVELVNQAKSHCLEAKEKGQALLTASRSIQDQLDSVGDLNRQSFRTVRQLATGGEIQEAIDLATNMDDVVMECSNKVTSMIDRVSDGFNEIPAILTDGMDMKEVGKQEDDPEPLDVELDVAELEESRQAIEEADLISAVRAGKRGFSGVSDKTSICEDTLALIDAFSGNCSKTIDSFLSVWDLKSASTKIQEMCRLVSVGEMMKQLAAQCKKLLLAIVALMKAAIKKFSEDFPDIADGMEDAVDAAKDKLDAAKDKLEDKLEDAVDATKDKIKNKLKFWK